MLNLFAKSLFVALGYEPDWMERRTPNEGDWERLPPHWRDRFPSPFEDRDI